MDYYHYLFKLTSTISALLIPNNYLLSLLLSFDLSASEPKLSAIMFALVGGLSTASLSAMRVSATIRLYAGYDNGRYIPSPLPSHYFNSLATAPTCPTSTPALQ